MSLITKYKHVATTDREGRRGEEEDKDTFEIEN